VRLAWALPSMEITNRLRALFIYEELPVLRRVHLVRRAHHQWGGLRELRLQ
jgi:hypothetical protein